MVSVRLNHCSELKGIFYEEKDFFNMLPIFQKSAIRKKMIFFQAGITT